jgi:hypothetical protein
MPDSRSYVVIVTARPRTKSLESRRARGVTRTGPGLATRSCRRCTLDAAHHMPPRFTAGCKGTPPHV